VKAVGAKSAKSIYLNRDGPQNSQTMMALEHVEGK